MAVSQTHQQFAREAAQLQESFTSFAKSIPEMPLQKQWHACEQIHKMQAQFDEFLSKAKSSFQHDPSIEQTRAKLEETSQRVSLIYRDIQIFNHCYSDINEDLRTYQTSNKDPRSEAAWLNDKLELIKQTLPDTKDNGSIAHAFQQLAEKLTSALQSGETSLNPACPLTDSLVQQLEIEKKKLDITDFGDTTGEFNSYLPFFEKLRKTSNDHPDLKEKNLTFIKVYTQTYNAVTLSIFQHSDHIWDIPQPRLLEEAKAMTQSLATVIDRTNPV